MSRQRSNICLGDVGGETLGLAVCGCTCPGNIPTILLKEIGINNLWLGRVRRSMFNDKYKNKKGPNIFPDTRVKNMWLCMSRRSSNISWGKGGTLGLTICACTCPQFSNNLLERNGVNNLWPGRSAGHLLTRTLKQERPRSFKCFSLLILVRLTCIRSLNNRSIDTHTEIKWKRTSIDRSRIFGDKLIGRDVR